MPRALHILPLLIIVAMLSFSVRLTEVVVGVKTLSGTAFAESVEQEGGHADSSSEHDGDTEQTAKVDDGHMAVVEDNNAQAPKWRDASDSDIDVTGVKLELFEDLSARRDALEKAKKELQVREALLKAAEQEVDRKVQELTKLRHEIESLLGQQSEEEEKRIGSLVKIYEGMKPKDAARIFDTLDLDVLVAVISKMSERKIAPVMAAMNPERARTITIMLAEQKKLPVLQ